MTSPGSGESSGGTCLRFSTVVLVDSRSPTRGQCSVSVDDVLGGDLAVSHLLDTGHTRIAFVGGPMSIRQAADRRDGAMRALERSGREAGELLVVETPALNVAAQIRLQGGDASSDSYCYR